MYALSVRGLTSLNTIISFPEIFFGLKPNFLINAAKTLIEHVKVNFNRKVKYKTQNSTYANIFLDNTQSLSNYIVGRQKDLQLEVPDYQIQRNDDLKIRESIMAITPEERKRLGINKSTLWQMQKNIKDGKRIKVYDKMKQKIRV